MIVDSKDVICVNVDYLGIKLEPHETFQLMLWHLKGVKDGWRRRDKSG